MCMKWVGRFALICLLSVQLSAASAAKKDSMAIPPEPRLLTWSQQISVREGWLAKRHGMILDLMRKYGVDWWIITNEEFHDDPLTQYIAPPRPYTGGRDIFLFIDTGDKGLRKVAITGF